MTPEAFIKSQIVVFAQQQAGQLGGFEPMLAVACVLRNRVKAGWFGGDWMANMNHAAERSALEPVLPRPLDTTSLASSRLMGAAEDIYSSIFKDELTNGGLYFLDSLYVEHGRQLRPWFLDNILQGTSHPRIAQVGMLWIFS